jgi:hypothetical protein
MSVRYPGLSLRSRHIVVNSPCGQRQNAYNRGWPGQDPGMFQS